MLNFSPPADQGQARDRPDDVDDERGAAGHLLHRVADAARRAVAGRTVN